MSENMYVNVWNVNNINLQSDIEGPYLYHRQLQEGVFLDFNCLKSQDILRKVKKR